jgi:hypothetical protein
MRLPQGFCGSFLYIYKNFLEHRAFFLVNFKKKYYNKKVEEVTQKEWKSIL